MIKIMWLLLVCFSLSLTEDLHGQVKNLVFVCEENEDLTVAIECFNLLEKKLPVKLTINRMPWKRCLEVELKMGKADGAFLASYKKEREEFGRYPLTEDGKLDDDKRYNTSGYVFYRLKKSDVEWNGKEMKNLSKPIGAHLGYSVVGELRSKGYEVEEAPTTLANMKKLVAGRIDLFAEIEEKGNQLLEENPDLSRQIEKIPIPYSSKPYFLMLSHQFVSANPELAKKIWDTVKHTRENEYKVIYRKYMQE